MLQTEYNKNLPAAIELSLSSPMFQQLGPDARDLLCVVTFLPPGVDENNLDWFPHNYQQERHICQVLCSFL